MDKTVYFLGAGFSKPAGGPIQNEIIKAILTAEFSNQYSSNIEINKALNGFKEFLTRDLYIDESEFANIALEDIFTPIDRCIADGKSFGSNNVSQLVILRDQLHSLLATSIQYLVDLPGNDNSYIEVFASYINSRAKTRLTIPKSDIVSVITTNWDILLDNQLQQVIDRNTEPQLAVVDYCCYISSLEDDKRIKPGLQALGEGGYNVKYLKLHGSMNWLHCPMCQRMYIKFEEKTMLSLTYHCKHCKKNYGLGDIVAVKLKGNLLLPTFLKDLSNIQIKLVWQNAGIELSEATKVVFIGYSLPAADFEIRQLLSKYIRKNANIEVVIYPNSTYKDDEKARYKNFFGARNIDFIEQTVPNYVDSLII